MVPERTSENCLTAEIWTTAPVGEASFAQLDPRLPRTFEPLYTPDVYNRSNVSDAPAASLRPAAVGKFEPLYTSDVHNRSAFDMAGVEDTVSTRGRPVLVWIPGGSFRIGGASLPTYDGRHLAADGDMVVIGLNYRLGLLGFLAAEGVPSNLGLRDLLAAIDWIRANAVAFGGDPERITLMGESAGAGAITHLLSRPDLPIAGAIVLSGSATMTLGLATARVVAETVFEVAGVSGAAGLAGRSVEDLLDVQTQAVGDLAATVGMMPFHPWVDGDVVPVAPLEAATAGALRTVPLVIGTTAHEMELFRPMVPTLPTEYAARYLQGRAAPLGLTPEGVAAGLAACDGDLVAAIADIDLQLPALWLAESHARRGLPVWRVLFTWESPGHQACHALDLPFHFGTLDVDVWREFAGATGADAEDADRLSEHLRQAWAQFAATGVPGCPSIGDWPTYVGNNRTAAASGGEHAGAPCNIGDDLRERSNLVTETGRNIRAAPDLNGSRYAAWRS